MKGIKGRMNEAATVPWMKLIFDGEVKDRPPESDNDTDYSSKSIDHFPSEV
jgi:hypothetical protein